MKKKDGTLDAAYRYWTIDSFFVRMGDVLSAMLVFAGTTMCALHPRGFAAVNAVIVVAWLALAWMVGRHYQRLTANERPSASGAAQAV